MAHTTTASTTYSLLKYSRSYPAGNSTGADWQHFTNPALRLVLDVTKTEKSELQSVRVKVIWEIQIGGVITLNDNAEIEDVDLLAFSYLPARKGAPMNIPLKAVYRDMTVGVRYLHPLNEINATSFRRFQISFTSEHDTSAFIDSIKMVCPCKKSPNPGASQQRQAINIVNPEPIIGFAPMQHQTLVLATPSTEGSQYLHGPTDPRNQPPTGQVRGGPQASLANRPDVGQMTTGTPKLVAMPPPPVPSQHSQKTYPPLDVMETGTSSQNIQPPPFTQPSHMSSQTYTAPSSSQASASSQRIGDTNLPIDIKNTAAQLNQEPASPAISSVLKEATTLYDLPLDILESAVGDVVREDGFVSLPDGSITEQTRSSAAVDNVNTTDADAPPPVDVNMNSMLQVTGLAGVGKSAIPQTIADECKDSDAGTLGATFFSRPNRRDSPLTILPSLPINLLSYAWVTGSWSLNVSLTTPQFLICQPLLIAIDDLGERNSDEAQRACQSARDIPPLVDDPDFHTSIPTPPHCFGDKMGFYHVSFGDFLKNP
ncbi:hypothetical protein P691DRAFT_772012 [Macrolepiota fuliginosa MF-IS2]|uniref:Uncharacterized protein n=1 Tax=Macrolepiota fuliginosa MF-IS2 TaxID=1400762 RepID=A0A9P6C5B9_9AGAR|nr:hypothetical protein P691DRAFT_772012 [Macrolepiota fuliginosa MF-IS2]